MRRRARLSFGFGLALALGAALAGCGRDEGPAPAPPEAAETWEGYGAQTVVLFFAEGGIEPLHQGIPGAIE